MAVDILKNIVTIHCAEGIKGRVEEIGNECVLSL